MAEDKKSVIIYTDWINIFEELDDAEAGQLIKHVMRYVNDKNPEAPSRLIKIVFEPIKLSLKRDLRKYEDKKLKNKENAMKRWHKTDAVVCDGINRNAKHADSDSDNVSDSDSDSVSGIIKNNNIDLLEGRIIDDCPKREKEVNKKIVRKFKHLSINETDYEKLINIGYTADEINDVFDRIENYKKNTNYTSLYLTSSKWLKKEYPDRKPKSKTEVTNANYWDQLKPEYK